MFKAQDGVMSCRLCGGQKLVAHLKAGEFQFHSCRACGYVQISPAPTPDELATLYNGPYFDQGKYVEDLAEQREQKARINLLKDAGVMPNARILDFGCATGVFMAHAQEGFEVWGAELSVDALAAARAKLPHLSDRLLGLDGLAALPRRTFDAVVLWDVVEHLLDPSAVLAEVMALLRPGGVLALSTPNIGSLTARLAGHRWAFMTPPEHVGFFKRQSLLRLMQTTGVRLVSYSSRGKWVNVGFLFHKLNRVLPELVSKELAGRVRTSAFGKKCVYVPTGDIIYAAGRLE